MGSAEPFAQLVVGILIQREQHRQAGDDAGQVLGLVVPGQGFVDADFTITSLPKEVRLILFQYPVVMTEA